jgi:hypothetical protein
MINKNYNSWLIKTNKIKKICDNEPQAKREYGRYSNLLEQNNNITFVKLWQWNNIKKEWILIRYTTKL